MSRTVIMNSTIQKKYYLVSRTYVTKLNTLQKKYKYFVIVGAMSTYAFQVKLRNILKN